MTPVSVVIITQGRVPLVEALLCSLDEARAELAATSEVLVVDDSRPSDAEALRRACSAHGARYVAAGSPSVSAKRNQGAGEAAFPVVLFLDSDCLATPPLLVEHARRYDDPAVHGVLGLLEFDGPGTEACAAVDLTPFAGSFGWPREYATVSWGPTANLSVRAASFAALGGFDETFPPRPGGEDVDLGLRLTARFGRLACAPEARALHTRYTWNSFRGNLRRFFQWGVADRYLVVRHPQRTFRDLPRLPVLAFTAAVAAMALAIVQGRPGWILAGLLVAPLAAVIDGTRQLPSRGLRGVWRGTIAHAYFFANELGCLWAFARAGEVAVAGTRLHFGRNQQYGEWVDSGVRIRAVTIAWLVLVVMMNIW